MRYRFSRVLAGILVMMLVVSSGSSTVFAGTNQRFAATGVVGIGEPGNADAPEEDTQSPKSDGTDGTTQAPEHSLPVATHL